MALGPVGSLRVVREELLLAASAAERWPVGRHRYSWFASDAAESEYAPPYRIPVPVARREGCPAVVIAACRVVRAGRAKQGIEWRQVWVAQAHLLDLVRAVAPGVRCYMDTLSEDPLRIASVLRAVVEDCFEEEA